MAIANKNLILCENHLKSINSNFADELLTDLARNVPNLKDKIIFISEGGVEESSDSDAQSDAIQTTIEPNTLYEKYSFCINVLTATQKITPRTLQKLLTEQEIKIFHLRSDEQDAMGIERICDKITPEYYLNLQKTLQSLSATEIEELKEFVKVLTQHPFDNKELINNFEKETALPKELIDDAFSDENSDHTATDDQNMFNNFISNSSLHDHTRTSITIAGLSHCISWEQKIQQQYPEHVDKFLFIHSVTQKAEPIIDCNTAPFSQEVCNAIKQIFEFISDLIEATIPSSIKLCNMDSANNNCHELAGNFLNYIDSTNNNCQELAGNFLNYADREF